MIGDILRLERIKSKVSQKEMASRYGASPQAIRNIEKADDVSTKLIRKYLACLGKDYEIVIVDKKEPA